VTVTVVSGKEEDVTKQNYARHEWVELPSRQTPSPSSDSCICVENYLCKNKTIITDGKGMFDVRYVLSL